MMEKYGYTPDGTDPPEQSKSKKKLPKGEAESKVLTKNQTEEPKKDVHVKHT